MYANWGVLAARLAANHIPRLQPTGPGWTRWDQIRMASVCRALCMTEHPYKPLGGLKSETGPDETRLHLSNKLESTEFYALVSPPFSLHH